MARARDEELVKAFSELQEKVTDTAQKIKLADLQIDSLKRSKQRSELTIAEVANLPANTKTYESVGRMFLLDDIASIKSGLQTRIKNADEKISTLENNKTKLTQSLQESKDSIREMVQQKQNK
ncbi:prefoldin subunit 1 [Microplitis demolitor]|uniref:prefoldin subunit 1 n=1 Tax=Microplitis demolitor TaxID=69319 RepID=UPI0004CDCC32|nr:prefoldin subunit 1 [Microplitis demolitor]